MKFILCTVFLLGSAFAASAASVNRVVGGQEAKPHEFPYMVSLQWNGNEPKGDHFCGGSLLNENWVLTAAHCVDAFNPETVVVAGAHNFDHPNGHEQKRTPKRTFIHDEYISGRVGPHDIALIEVTEPFELNKYVKTLQLPSGEAYYPTGHATLSGWGSTSNTSTADYPGKLFKADLPILTEEVCFSIDTQIHETNICAGETSLAACSADSGSPLVQKNSRGNVQVFGITSWSWLPCGMPGKPGIFVNVMHYREWINKIMNSQ